jgi:hypothetical protein
MLRGVPQAATLEEATAFLRGNWLDRIQEHHEAHSGGLPVKTIVDVGCATGISTRFLADRFASADEVVVSGTALGSAAKFSKVFRIPLLRTESECVPGVCVRGQIAESFRRGGGGSWRVTLSRSLVVEQKIGLGTGSFARLPVKGLRLTEKDANVARFLATPRSVRHWLRGRS